MGYQHFPIELKENTNTVNDSTNEEAEFESTNV